MEELTRRKAKRIAKRYVSSLITYFDGFHSDLLSHEDNMLIKEECMNIAIKLYDGESFSEADNIVKAVLKSK